MPEARYIGVDLGGTLVRAALGNAAGQVLHRADAATHAERGEAAIADGIAALVRQAVGSTRLADVAAVALGVPGPVDPVSGTLYDAPNLVKGEFQIKAMLEQRLEVPVHVANDANVAAIGEWRYGGHGDTQHLVYITVSTGVGAGIIADGRVLDGFNRTAGEVGHMVIDPNGPPCNCGNRGCVEAFCSGTHIGERAREALARGESSRMLELAGGSIEAVTAKEVVAAARQGDAVAGRIFHDAADHLGLAVVNVIHLLSPEYVVIGGGVSQAGDLLFGPVRDRVARTAMTLPAKNVHVEPARLGVDSGLIGAVGMAIMAAAQSAGAPQS